MGNNNLHRTIPLSNATYWDPDTGEQLDTTEMEHLLIRDIHHITALSEYHLLGNETLRDDLNNYLQDDDNPRQATAIGRALGITWPPDIQPARATGASRQGEIARARTINETLSYLERWRACQGTTEKHVSQGWARTVNPTPPRYLAPRVELSNANRQYSYWSNDVLSESVDYLELMLVIDYRWVLVLLPKPKKRILKDALKLCLPNLRPSEDGSILYDVVVEYEYHYTLFNINYAVTVDVGTTQYATVSYVETATGTILESSTLSERIHALANSIKASEGQKRNLRNKGDLCARAGDAITATSYYQEAVLHREAASRKKRELAIIAGQEIAAFAFERGNAPVLFEDLGWIKNTMQNGRWNRGALLKWTRDYVEFNGGRLFTVNSWNTSQDCHVCGEQVMFLDDRIVRCYACGMVADRDVNATGNIGKRGHELLKKAVATRAKAKKATEVAVRRSPLVRPSLKYPGRDRSKSGPTLKRPRKRKPSSARGEVLSGIVNSSPRALSERKMRAVVGDVSAKNARGGTFLRQLEPYRYDLDRVFRLEPVYRS